SCLVLQSAFKQNSAHVCGNYRNGLQWMNSPRFPRPTYSKTGSLLNDIDTIIDRYLCILHCNIALKSLDRYRALIKKLPRSVYQSRLKEQVDNIPRAV